MIVEIFRFVYCDWKMEATRYLFSYLVVVLNDFELFSF